MPDPAPKSFFVLTLRGDRGPLDRAGVRELLRQGEARAEDQVRDIFGRQYGTVADIAATCDSEAAFDHKRKQSERTATSGSGFPQLILIGIAAVITLGIAVIWVVSIRPESQRALRAAQSMQPIPMTTVPPVAVTSPTVSQSSIPAQPLAIPTATAELPRREPELSQAPSTPVAADAGRLTEIPSLPGWISYEIGGANAGTGPDIVAGVWTMSGNGDVIWKSSEGCRMAATSLDGNGRISARLINLKHHEESNLHTGAGIMMRLSKDPSAPKVFLGLSVAGKMSFGIRKKPGKMDVVNTYKNKQSPLWLRLVRSGTQISAWISNDGNAWRVVGEPIDMPAFHVPILAGPVVGSGSMTDVYTATFDHVVVESLP
ncbi:MAG: hypothetical protein AAB263_08375, partial [Planctomycetota bacterium]